MNYSIIIIKRITIIVMAKTIPANNFMGTIIIIFDNSLNLLLEVVLKQDHIIQDLQLIFTYFSILPNLSSLRILRYHIILKEMHNYLVFNINFTSQRLILLDFDLFNFFVIYQINYSFTNSFANFFNTPNYCFNFFNQKYKILIFPGFNFVIKVDLRLINFHTFFIPFTNFIVKILNYY